MKVAVLGAGSWGSAIAGLLATKVDTTIWARSESIAKEIHEQHTNHAYLADAVLATTLRSSADLEEVLSEVDLVVIGIPSHGVRDVLQSAAPFVPNGIPVVSLAKGLEQSSLKTVTGVVLDCWPDRPVGVLTGPNLAIEVLDGQPTASVIAMTDDDLARDLQVLFSGEFLRVYTNSDVIGCEIAGVVKNVMAIAAGMVVGLGFGDNTRAALITRSLAEIARIGVALGGQPLTFAGLAGLGDLVATCTSQKSRNFSVGVALGKGSSLRDALGGMRMVAEGVQSSKPVVALAHQLDVETPVADEVVAVCYEGRSAAEALPRLMSRAVKAE